MKNSKKILTELAVILLLSLSIIVTNAVTAPKSVVVAHHETGNTYITAVTEVSCEVLKIEQANLVKELKQEIRERRELVPKSIVTIEEIEIEEPEQPSNRWGISLTDDERYLLAQITYLEAGDQGLVGQEAVVEIIFNRMKDDYFQGTLYEVLSKKGQFVTWSFRNKAKPTEETYQAIDEVLAGNTDIFGPEYLYFSRGGHKSHNGYYQLGDHQFCTE